MTQKLAQRSMNTTLFRPYDPQRALQFVPHDFLGFPQLPKRSTPQKRFASLNNANELWFYNVCRPSHGHTRKAPCHLWTCNRFSSTSTSATILWWFRNRKSLTTSRQKRWITMYVHT